jgi:hypothetical protein
MIMEFPMNDAAEKIMKAQRALIDSSLHIGSSVMASNARLANHQMAMVNKVVEAGTKQFALLKDAQNPTDAMEKSTAYAAEAGQELASMVRESVELQVEISTSMADTIKAEFTKVAA